MYIRSYMLIAKHLGREAEISPFQLILLGQILGEASGTSLSFFATSRTETAVVVGSIEYLPTK